MEREQDRKVKKEEEARIAAEQDRERKASLLQLQAERQKALAGARSPKEEMARLEAQSEERARLKKMREKEGKSNSGCFMNS